MNLAALFQNPGLILRLAVVPNVCEALTASGLIAALFCCDLPYSLALMGGFLLSAVSPAVVVPSLIRLQEAKLGTAKGIPTLVLAAASFDDVLSISGFGVLLGITYSTGDDPVWVGFRGPVELFAGAAFGLVVGTALARLLMPLPLRGETAVPPALAAATAVGVSCMAVLGGKALRFSGGGTFAVIVTGLALLREWGQQSAPDAQASAPPAAIEMAPAKHDDVEAGGALVTDEGGEAAGVDSIDVEEAKSPQPVALDSAHPRVETAATQKLWLDEVKGLLKGAWRVAQPMLFALIGAAVDLRVVQASAVGLAVAVVVVAVTVRCCITYAVLLPDAFLTHAERTFLAIAWLPKATVQAAIGSVALDTARATGDAEEGGLILLTLAVVAILVTAPAGALAIAVGGPRLLQREGGGDTPLQPGSGEEEEEEAEEDTGEGGAAQSETGG